VFYNGVIVEGIFGTLTFYHFPDLGLNSTAAAEYPEPRIVSIWLEKRTEIQARYGDQHVVLS